MSVAVLVRGMLLLLLVLIAVALLGAIGSVELMVWLGLEVVWVLWWVRSRGRHATA